VARDVARPFVHLHVHSDFSFMDGAVRIADLVERAQRLGMPAVALTDHQGLYGAVRFYRAALAAGVTPIVGAEVAVEAAGVPGAECDEPPRSRLVLPAAAGFGRAGARGFHLTLLAKDITGYRNLCRLLSRAHLREEADGGPPRSVIALRDLSRMSEGLIGLSGCAQGEVGAAVVAGASSRARAAAERLAGLFAPGDFFIELMHAMTPDSPRYIAALAGLADSLGLPVVATNDVHYLTRADSRLHDVLSAVGARTALPGPLARPNAELFFKSASEMRRLFAGRPDACDNTVAIAERCRLDLGLGSFHFPSVEVPHGETPYSVLSKAAWRGIEGRYRPVTPEAVRRVQHELSVIEDLGFAEYFLVVKDIVDHAKGRGLHRHLRARDHRRRSHRERAALRAVPQPGA
jgi:DNA polymerase-3 subunit alpha